MSKRVPDHRRTIWVNRRTLAETHAREKFLLDFARPLFAAEDLGLYRTAAAMWQVFRIAVEETRFRGEPLGCAAWRMRVPGTRPDPRRGRRSR